MSTTTMGDTTPEPRPVIPALGRHYGFTSDLAYLIVRVTAGLMLIPHGWAKVMNLGVDRVATSLGNYGVPSPKPFAIIIMVLETIGGIMIALGLFTRIVAAMLVVEFLVIIFVAHWPKGYAVGAGGVEFPLMWGLLLLAVLLRGGGPWSVDRKLGWEV
jgi:putative oxidoreductase